MKLSENELREAIGDAGLVDLYAVALTLNKNPGATKNDDETKLIYNRLRRRLQRDPDALGEKPIINRASGTLWTREQLANIVAAIDVLQPPGPRPRRVKPEVTPAE